MAETLRIRTARRRRRPEQAGFFRQPTNPNKPEATKVGTLYEHAGGDEALHRLEELFYDRALADPILKTLF
jgi:hypothetical protein